MASEEARDWRTGMSLIERQRNMYEGKYACDVTFIVGKVKPEKISAHRFVLVSGSPVFEAMLTHGREGDIVVKDVEPEVFNAVLKFLYCEQIELKDDTAMDVLQAARNYEASQLVVKCTDYLMGTIDVHNVCLYLTKSVQYEENELSAGCIELISRNTEQVLDSTEFPGISHRSLKRILESHITNSVSPQKVYTACLRWADAQCTFETKAFTDENRRAALGSCLYLICFPDMSSKLFTDVTRKSNLLTSEERGQVYEFIACREHGYEYQGTMVFKVEKCKPREEYKETMVFNVEKPREEYKVMRFKGLKRGAWDEAGTSAVDFQCSSSVWISGVGLYVGWNNTDNEVIVKLMDDEGKVLAYTGNVVMKYEHDFTMTNCNNPIAIRFPENVRIRRNQLYRITAEYRGKQNRYGTKGQETVENGGVEFTFRQTPGNKTTVCQGQIPEIIFAT